MVKHLGGAKWSIKLSEGAYFSFCSTKSLRVFLLAIAGIPTAFNWTNLYILVEERLKGS